MPESSHHLPGSGEIFDARAISTSPRARSPGSRRTARPVLPWESGGTLSVCWRSSASAAAAWRCLYCCERCVLRGLPVLHEDEVGPGFCHRARLHGGSRSPMRRRKRLMMWSKQEAWKRGGALTAAVAERAAAGMSTATAPCSPNMLPRSGRSRSCRRGSRSEHRPLSEVLRRIPQDDDAHRPRQTDQTGRDRTPGADADVRACRDRMIGKSAGKSEPSWSTPRESLLIQSRNCQTSGVPWQSQGAYSWSYATETGLAPLKILRTNGDLFSGLLVADGDFPASASLFTSSRFGWDFTFISAAANSGGRSIGEVPADGSP